jgi:hypothetical protein
MRAPPRGVLLVFDGARIVEPGLAGNRERQLTPPPGMGLMGGTSVQTWADRQLTEVPILLRTYSIHTYYVILRIEASRYVIFVTLVCPVAPENMTAVRCPCLIIPGNRVMSAEVLRSTEQLPT